MELDMVTLSGCIHKSVTATNSYVKAARKAGLSNEVVAAAVKAPEETKALARRTNTEVRMSSAGGRVRFAQRWHRPTLHAGRGLPSSKMPPGPPPTRAVDFAQTWHRPTLHRGIDGLTVRWPTPDRNRTLPLQRVMCTVPLHERPRLGGCREKGGMP